MAKAGRKKSYEAYVKYYNAEKKKMKKQGYSMYLPKLTKSQWTVRYNAMMEDRLEEMSLGNRKIIGNVNRDIAVSQKWQKSTEQAKALVNHWNKTWGKKPNIKDIRSGKTNIDSQIKMRYNDLKSQGLLSSEISQIITDEFYGGSP